MFTITLRNYKLHYLIVASFSSMYFNAPPLVHIMGKGGNVRGVTCLGDEVFIVCQGKAEVQVFDVDTLSLKRRLPVTGLSSAGDLVSCAQNGCLYSCNSNGIYVFKIVANGNTVNWTTTRTTFKLSVTAKSNVLVTSRDTCKLMEFTADGRLLREIDLQLVSGYLCHSVQLSNGQIVVSSSRSDKRVYVINDDGKPVQTYSGGIGSASGQIQCTCYLFVDKQGFIAAVDDVNNNVVLLSPSLTYVRELIAAGKGLPKNPFRTYFEESRRLLFVAGSGDGLLSVFKGETTI